MPLATFQPRFGGAFSLVLRMLGSGLGQEHTWVTGKLRAKPHSPMAERKLGEARCDAARDDPSPDEEAKTPSMQMHGAGQSHALDEVSGGSSTR